MPVTVIFVLPSPARYSTALTNQVPSLPVEPLTLIHLLTIIQAVKFPAILNHSLVVSTSVMARPPMPMYSYCPAASR